MSFEKHDLPNCGPTGWWGFDYSLKSGLHICHPEIRGQEWIITRSLTTKLRPGHNNLEYVCCKKATICIDGRTISEITHPQIIQSMALRGRSSSPDSVCLSHCALPSRYGQELLLDPPMTVAGSNGSDGERFSPEHLEGPVQNKLTFLLAAAFWNLQHMQNGWQ